MKRRILFLTLAWIGVYAISAFSQILYSDIVPDTVVCTPPGEATREYPIDMNRDGKPDFNINHFYGRPDWISVEAFCYYDWATTNYPCYILVNDLTRGLALDEGDEITAGTLGT